MHGAAAGLLVVAIHVLRYNNQIRFLFQGNQGMVGGVGLALGDELAAPVVPAPDQLRIFGESRVSGQIFRAVFAPEGILRTPKSGDAAGCRNSGPCE